MTVHIRTMALFLTLALLPARFCAADSIAVGSPAPDFNVVSGDNKTLTLNDIKGKTAVLFYESKNAVEQNRKLKTALNEFYDSQPENIKDGIIRISVIDCKGVMFAGAWKKELRENSAKEGITIYGDWDGRMSADYSVKAGVSNVMVIDKGGTVRYSGSGKIADADIGAIEGLLKGLTGGR